MINTKRVQELVTALRSGKYKQARAELKSVDGGFYRLDIINDGF